MDIRDMQYFLAVAEAGSITGAAQMLHVAQPTITRQMQALEEELGTQLLVRGNRNTSLTSAGLVLQRRCDQILSAVDHTVKEVGAMQDDVAGVLSIGTISTAGAKILPRWVRRYRAVYPLVTYQLWRAQAMELFDLFNKNVIEVAFLTRPVDERVYDCLPIETVPLTVAMPQDAPIGKRADTVALHELDDVPLILPHRFKRQVEEAFVHYGLHLNLLCDSKSIADDLMWVREGIACAVTPSWSRAMMVDGLRYKTIADPPLSVEYAMVWRRNVHLSLAAQRFIELQAEQLAALPG